MKPLSIRLIEELLSADTKTIFVGYSGGVDSHVLLHLCANDPLYRRRIVAVYVHHGLQAEADAWAEHCRRIAGQLGVGFRQLRVDAHPNKRQSPEEAARIARYAAFETLLGQGDALLLAQHGEDQLETVLLQLFRGAGVAGLAAMPASVPFGQGMMLRPLLGSDKQSIWQYAAKHKLQWVEDPSNRAVDYDRNFLRNNIIPLLKQRWPSLDKTVSRSARHCAEAAELLAGMADELLQLGCDRRDKSLAVDRLLGLESSRRTLLLRRWFRYLGLQPPGEVLVQTIVREVAEARAGADPELRTQGRSIRRYRGRLYCLSENSLLPDKCRIWPEGSKRLRQKNGYCLRLVPAQAGIPVVVWEQAVVTVKRRQGGESLALSGRKGRHSLKKLFQEASVPPWQRKRMPLIYLDGRLAAVADLWLAAEFFCAGGEPCYRISWETEE